MEPEKNWLKNSQIISDWLNKLKSIDGQQQIKSNNNL